MRTHDTFKHRSEDVAEVKIHVKFFYLVIFMYFKEIHRRCTPSSHIAYERVMFISVKLPQFEQVFDYFAPANLNDFTRRRATELDWKE